MEIIISRIFKKQAQKLVENKKALKEKINEVIVDFSGKGRRSNYYRKKLKGNYIGYEELQVGGDIRIVVRISFDEKKAVIQSIGSHSQLYG